MIKYFVSYQVFVGSCGVYWYTENSFIERQEPIESKKDIDDIQNELEGNNRTLILNFQRIETLDVSLKGGSDE